MRNRDLAAHKFAVAIFIIALVGLAIVGSGAVKAQTNPDQQYQDYPTFPTEQPTPIPTPSPTPEPKITPGSPLTLGGSTISEFIQQLDIFQIAFVVLALLGIVWIIVIFVYAGKAITKKAAKTA